MNETRTVLRFQASPFGLGDGELWIDRETGKLMMVVDRDGQKHSIAVDTRGIENPIPVNLRELVRLADEACRDAYKNGECRDDAINWGDLGCRDAGFCMDEGGSTYYKVTIDEASPSAEALRKFVRDYLKSRGYPGVVVETEW